MLAGFASKKFVHVAAGGWSECSAFADCLRLTQLEVYILIEIYTGYPGTGKSLHVAQRVRSVARRGYPVISNVKYQLKKGRSIYVPNNRLSPEALEKFALVYWEGKGQVKEGSILLVIDEAQLMLNSRDWQDSARMSWLGFFSQHRKLGYSIVLVAQTRDMLDKQIRSLAEEYVAHVRIDRMRILGPIIRILSFGHPVVLCSHRYAGVRQDSRDSRLRSEYVIGRRSLYRVYDSYQRW